MPLISKERRTPCRCSRRNCRARRTLAKHPDAYKYAPKCDVAGCDGSMRPDKFRTKGRLDKNIQEKDSGKRCTCNGYPWAHRVSNKNCEKYEDFVIDSVLAGRRQGDVGATDENEVPF